MKSDKPGLIGRKIHGQKKCFHGIYLLMAEETVIYFSLPCDDPGLGLAMSAVNFVSGRNIIK